MALLVRREWCSNEAELEVCGYLIDALHVSGNFQSLGGHLREKVFQAPRERTAYVALTFVGLGLGVQLIPYGRSQENPPVLREPEWDQPATRALFFLACGDCHSNETSCPWYSQVASVSWLVQRGVDEGRSHLNVSEWGRSDNHGDEAVQLVRDGEMPPWFYLPAHPEARLSQADQASLIEGLLATFPEREDGHHHDGQDHDH